MATAFRRPRPKQLSVLDVLIHPLPFTAHLELNRSPRQSNDRSDCARPGTSTPPRLSGKRPCLELVKSGLSHLEFALVNLASDRIVPSSSPQADLDRVYGRFEAAFHSMLPLRSGHEAHPSLLHAVVQLPGHQ